MKTQTCYRAIFNVGNTDVWSSEMYLDKDAIFDELEEAKDEIAGALRMVTEIGIPLVLFDNSRLP